MWWWWKGHMQQGHCWHCHFQFSSTTCQISILLMILMLIFFLYCVAFWLRLCLYSDYNQWCIVKSTDTKKWRKKQEKAKYRENVVIVVLGWGAMERFGCHSGSVWCALTYSCAWMTGHRQPEESPDTGTESHCLTTMTCIAFSRLYHTNMHAHI